MGKLLLEVLAIKNSVPSVKLLFFKTKISLDSSPKARESKLGRKSLFFIILFPLLLYTRLRDEY
jgi:hypothetical protein